MNSSPVPLYDLSYYYSYYLSKESQTPLSSIQWPVMPMSLNSFVYIQWPSTCPSRAFLVFLYEKTYVLAVNISNYSLSEELRAKCYNETLNDSVIEINLFKHLKIWLSTLICKHIFLSKHSCPSVETCGFCYMKTAQNQFGVPERQ